MNQIKYQNMRIEKAKMAYQDVDFYKDGLRWPVERWPLETNRYQFVWLPACPRAHRVAIVYRMLGLDQVIEEVRLSTRRDEKGWRFEDGTLMRERFEEPAHSSQPFVYDTKTNQVVTTDQYNMSLFFLMDWQEYHQANAPDLYPQAMQKQIDAMNGYIFEQVNVQVYKAGHAKTPVQHTIEAERLFATLEQLDEHLSTNAYLNGSRLTDSDFRLLTNLLRADIYYKQFNLNKKHITAFPNLLRYTRELYQIPAVQETTHHEDILETHYRSPHNVIKFGNQYEAQRVNDAFGWLVDK